MPAPRVTLSETMLERLTAAADHLEIHRHWVERGDPRCAGRDFGFWQIQVGLHGWPERVAARPPAPLGLAAPAYDIREGVLTVEAADLDLGLGVALDAARKRWPESGA